MVLAETASESRVLNLAENKMSGVMNYLKPNALIGILFMLFVLSILLFAFLSLMEVQTPMFFPTESIDFGKIEKWRMHTQYNTLIA